MIGKVRALPIDSLIPEIQARVKAGGNLVVEAPPGAGKTTRVPPALLDPGEVLVLEPRRIAARLAARRVAWELGERVGETVGYQVRFEDVSGPKTRLKFLTEGVLTRRLLRDPELNGVAVVVLDEFHERRLDGDFALALLRRLQLNRRPDLRLIVMSATLDAAPVAAHLGDCPRLRAAGRLFDLTVSWTPHSAAPLEEQVADALAKLLGQGQAGDVLVFLPGAAEIHRAARVCEPMVKRHGLELLPLHGDLSPEEQDRAVAPSERRKVILSTNVAESSITIDGVTAVIDSGLARVAEDSPWSGIPTLRVARISQASATQRAGRAARTAPGRVIRLFSAEDYARRPVQNTPEIVRRELSQVLLDMHAIGAGDLPWFEPPPSAAVAAAEALLARLGAMTASGVITRLGRRMAELPLNPRLARLVMEAESRGVGDEGCRFAARLSGGERSAGTEQLYLQIRRMARIRTRGGDDDALQISVLCAFPDRVARRRQGRELLLCGGGSAVLAEDSAATFLVAVDVEERQEKGLPLVRLASPIQAEWLLDLFPQRMREEDRLVWNRPAERVDRLSSLFYEDLAIETSSGGMPSPQEASRLLAEKALEQEIGRFAEPEAVAAFLARVEFAGLRHSGREAVRAALESACQGLRSFAELDNALREVGLIGRLKLQLSGAERRLLDDLAPERIRLPGGKPAKLHYERGKAPWVTARLQDFFGAREGPRAGPDKVSVVLHLLAPNMRPVQTTTDLAGFWERLYPQVRKELMRRYPKHAWPERPV